MNTSETSTTSFEEKCAILAQVRLEEIENPAFEVLMKLFSLHFNFSLLIEFNFATATDKGIELIDKLWETLLVQVGAEDQPEPIRTFEDLKYWASEGIFSED
jgi:hypothetical protein